MKTKIKKIKSSHNITERLAGVGTWRIVGMSQSTGKREVVHIEGTRSDAEKHVIP